MYCPDHFALNDQTTIREIMAAHPLAVFATNGPNGPETTHLPLVVRDEADKMVIYGHFARANPHWKVLDGKTHALAVFTGPEGYISPSWYATKQETGKVVPTWNYVTVQARGIPELLAHGAESREAIDTLTDAMEQPRANPWHVDDAPKKFTESMMRGIVAFRMVVTSLGAKAKLSQNRNAADLDGTIGGLDEDGAINLANAMRSVKPE